MSFANIITLSRVPLLLALVWLIYQYEPWSIFTALGLLPILFLMDWFDGYVARYRDEVTDLGSVLDIAIDRVVENVLWIVLADLNRAPVWVAITFIIRSFLVDGLRGYALARGHSAFGMMHSRLGRFLVASRFMRALYGLIKGLAFGAMILNLGLYALHPQAGPGTFLLVAEGVLVYSAAGLCILRGAPVFWDIRDIMGLTGEKP